MALKFPDNFFWGVATSAHQVEGNNHNDWTEWEKENSERLAKEAKNRWQSWQQEKFPEMFNPDDYISGRACDFYNRFEDDLDLAQSLNNNAFRFSIEWSRIEPEEGKFDADAIDYYRRLLWACRQRNLEPFVTLWHWTLPLWFAKLGGFEKENNLFYFERFVKRVVENFGSQVNFWITLNEPEIYAANAYFLGFFPPQKKSFLPAVRVFHNLIKVHREIYKIIHQIFPGASVGIAKNNSYFEAAGGKFINKSFKKAADYFWNDYFLSKIKGRMDFIGLNYYFHNRIDFDWRHLRTSFSRNKNESVSDMGWEIYPEGIYYVLKDLKKYNKPIYITENGLADTKDEKRAKFIKDHLRWTHKAIQEGVDARGYFHWSLLDNFEWDKGFWPRFGLVEVDWQTLERRKRPSADFYASIAKNNGLD